MGKGLEARRTDIFTFINKKLLIDDVEPMYSAIIRAELPLETRRRLCMAEGLCDHLGLAAKMASEGGFWGNAMSFVNQTNRGGSRRHFRGEVAKNAIRWMSRKYTKLDQFFDNMPDTYAEAREYILAVPQFGPFSAFKIADMSERTCEVEVDFSKVGMDGLSKFPRRGLQLAADYLKVEPKSLLDKLLNYDWVMLAPPHRDRALNIQEIETCLCNYGHSKWHEPGYEAAELHKLLDGYGPLADSIKDALPKGTE